MTGVVDEFEGGNLPEPEKDTDDMGVENLPELKKLDVTIPKVKMIQFGDEFEEWTNPKKIVYLKRLASTMNQAADILQQERNKLLVEVESLKKQLENAESNVTQHKTIMINAVTQYNDERQNLSREIQELQVRVKAQDKVIEMLNESLKSKVDK